MTFEIFILLGYVSGIIGKLVGGHITYVFIFCIVNTIMVSVDILLYFRNMRLDRRTQERG